MPPPAIRNRLATSCCPVEYSNLMPSPEPTRAFQLRYLLFESIYASVLHLTLMLDGVWIENARPAITFLRLEPQLSARHSTNG
jgi:hypothetical protein